MHLHIAAGTSYYKAAAPAVVIVDGGGLTAEEADFHRHLYDDGLREFAVVNGLPVPRPVTIVSDPVTLASTPVGRAGRREGRFGNRPNGLVVPIGGGKDSLVLAEALRPLQPRLFAVDPHPLVVDLAGQAGLDLLVARRTLSPELSRLNQNGALNGHVPITAIVSLIGVLGASIYGYDTIAMAIERSASEETVMVDGVPVNHQYSKSRQFEELLRGLVASSVDAELTLRVGPSSLFGAGHQSFLRCPRPLSPHLLQLQHRLPAQWRGDRWLVRPVRQVPVRRSYARPLSHPWGALLHYGDRSLCRPGRGSRVCRLDVNRRQTVRVRRRAARVGGGPAHADRAR